MSIRSLTLAILMASRVAGLPAALAQVLPLGPEFQVNSYTTNFQSIASVASDSAGNFVVTWSSYGSAGSDPDFSIQAQRYDNAGMPLGGEFQVNSYTTGWQLASGVAIDGLGNFVVVWRSAGSAGSDTSGYSIQGQRFDSTGAAQGGEFQVNTYTTGAQNIPAVATDGAGNFVVVWQSAGGAGSDSGDSIQGQRFDSTGAAQGGQFQINSYMTSTQSYPAVATAAAGNFVVVWHSDGSGSDYDWSVQAQRYDSAGTPLGGEFQVNSYTTGFQLSPAVAIDGLGNFVVTWADNNLPARSIRGQRYNSSGTPQGGEFEIATNASFRGAGVTADGAGNVVVVWGGTGQSSDSDGSVQGRRYDGLGTPQGPQFQINTYTSGGQGLYVRGSASPVAIDALGNFVVVWDSHGSTGSDTSSASVQGQRFAIVPTTTTTSTTSTTLPPTDLLRGRILIIKPGFLAKFVTRPVTGDTFALPAADPMTVGGALRIFDLATTAGDFTYNLPSGAAWKGLGSPAGSKGYKYKGAGTPDDPCKVILIKETLIKGVCRYVAPWTPPFDGDIGVVLSLGTTDRYCAQFGGDESRNDATLTRRRNAPAPGACP